LKIRTVPLPLPLPITLGPTIASSQGYLFIGTSDTVVQSALAAKAGEKPGLKTTVEFKHLSRDIPAQGNSFMFVSERFGQTLRSVQRQALAMLANAPAGQKELLQNFLSGQNAPVFYSVAGCTDEGWLGVANGNQHPAKLFMVSGIIPASILGAVALPALAKAKQHAQNQ
jgi:hypothetical protein